MALRQDEKVSKKVRASGLGLPLVKAIRFVAIFPGRGVF
jgi:hypothetical protein